MLMDNQTMNLALKLGDGEEEVIEGNFKQSATLQHKEVPFATTQHKQERVDGGNPIFAVQCTQ